MKNLKLEVLRYARENNPEKLKFLLTEHQLNWIDCRHSTGDSPLHVAAHEGALDVVRFLLDTSLSQGISAVDVINGAGKTPLHEAAQNCHPECVQYLLEKGANSRALKQADWTPLMLACTKTGENALGCCKILIKFSGPDALADRNKDGWTALHIAVREGDAKIISALLDGGKQYASLASKNGRTPLHTAALHGCSDAVKLLLESNSVDSNAADSCGSTPLHDSVRNGNIEIFKLLEKAGADVKACNFVGLGVLHMAAETGQCDLLEYLLNNYNFSVNERNNHGLTTPLSCAVRAGQTKAVHYILERGGDPLILDAKGRSCVQLIPSNCKDIQVLLNKQD